jgi:hypothetical protein
MVGSGALAAVLLWLVGCSTSGPQPQNVALPLNLQTGTTLSCPPPQPADEAHRDPLLQRLFTVQDTNNQTYTLGVLIDPFRGPNRSYRLGPPSGNTLAVEPATGGRPVGYGTGTLTVGDDPRSGSIDATINLKSGHAITVHGRWICE